MKKTMLERAIRIGKRFAGQIGHHLQEWENDLCERRRTKTNGILPNSLFLWIPKSAGTSLNAVLSSLGSQTFLSVEKARKYFRNRGIVTFGHISIPSLISLGVVSREYLRTSFKFAIVRNPYDRAVSLYEYLRKCGTLPASTTFPLFCSYLEARAYPPIGDFNHVGLNQLNCQMAWLLDSDKKRLPDFIGRFENLAHDMTFVFKQLGVFTAGYTFPHENKSTRRAVESYYSEREISIVRDVYRQDFEAFDYSEVPPWKQGATFLAAGKAA